MVGALDSAIRAGDYSFYYKGLSASDLCSAIPWSDIGADAGDSIEFRVISGDDLDDRSILHYVLNWNRMFDTSNN